MKTDKYKEKNQKRFPSFFDIDAKIDLYEIINIGMDEIQVIQKMIRETSLYKKYSQSKLFLLGIENKISRDGIYMINPPFYFESCGNEQDLKACFVAIDMIKFIDHNIFCYPCNSSIADKFITTAPQAFVRKCHDKIYIPALNQKSLENKDKLL